jgi:hypothetical protein
MPDSSAIKTDKSPFVRPTVMHGYPLDPAEKAALTRALDEVEQSRTNTNGSGPSSHEPHGHPRPASASPGTSD